MANQWIVGTVYALGEYAEPTAYNGYKYECTVAGTSHAATEPTWPTILGNTVVDNAVTWTCRAHSDLTKPGLSSKYLGFLTDIKDTLVDLARMFNPDTSTANLPTGAIRRNPTTKRFEEWNGSAWIALDLTGQLTGMSTVNRSPYTTSGSSTVYTVTIPEVTALTSGDAYLVKIDEANTTTAPTIAISGLTAKTIKKEGGIALVAGDLPINHEAILKYNGTDMVLINPAIPTSAGNSDTVDSYHASGLLARSAHTGTQAISTLSDHNKTNHDALDIDADTVDGKHITLVASGSVSVPATDKVQIPLIVGGTPHLYLWDVWRLNPGPPWIFRSYIPGTSMSAFLFNGNDGAYDGLEINNQSADAHTVSYVVWVVG